MIIALFRNKKHGNEKGTLEKNACCIRGGRIKLGRNLRDAEPSWHFRCHCSSFPYLVRLCTNNTYKHNKRHFVRKMSYKKRFGWKYPYTQTYHGWQSLHTNRLYCQKVDLFSTHFVILNMEHDRAMSLSLVYNEEDLFSWRRTNQMFLTM